MRPWSLRALRGILHITCVLPSRSYRSRCSMCLMTYALTVVILIMWTTQITPIWAPYCENKEQVLGSILYICEPNAHVQSTNTFCTKLQCLNLMVVCCIFLFHICQYLYIFSWYPLLRYISYKPRKLINIWKGDANRFLTTCVGINTLTVTYGKHIIVLVYWATPFKIHTSGCGRFWKEYQRGSVTFQMHLA